MTWFENIHAQNRQIWEAVYAALSALQCGGAKSKSMPDIGNAEVIAAYSVACMKADIKAGEILELIPDMIRSIMWFPAASEFCDWIVERTYSPVISDPVYLIDAFGELRVGSKQHLVARGESFYETEQLALEARGPLALPQATERGKALAESLLNDDDEGRTGPPA